VKIILQGVVGSTAYGLATPDSDVDRLGVYAEPATAFHGLHLPVDKAASKVTTNPDMSLHEARKFCQLALRCNPTVSELLWLREHEIREWQGYDLVCLRRSFLSAKLVRDAYFGYATQQFRLLRDTGQFQSKMRARTEKHARHLLRLLDQGYWLYVSGVLDVRVADPQRFMLFGEQVAQDHSYAEKAMADYESMFNAAVSPLPDRPDEAAVEGWLQMVRRTYVTEEDCA
jgi:predicted nucleotidyltransferase